MRDNIDAEAVLRHLVDGQAHPVERDRALRRDKGHQFRRRLEDKAHQFRLRPPLDDPRHSVDMAQDEMPAELVAEPERSFEIDRRALLPFAEGGAGQSLDRRLHRECSGFDRDDGKARSRAGDRGAERDRRGVKSRGDRQIEKFAAAQPPHPAHIGDDPGEHGGKATGLSGDLPGPPRSRPDSLVDGKKLRKSPHRAAKSIRSSPSQGIDIYPVTRANFLL